MGTASYSEVDSEPVQNTSDTYSEKEGHEPDLPDAPVPTKDSFLGKTVDNLEGRIAGLEAKIKGLEENAVKSAHDRITAVESFLKSKYPYSL